MRDPNECLNTHCSENNCRDCADAVWYGRVQKANPKTKNSGLVFFSYRDNEVQFTGPDHIAFQRRPEKGSEAWQLFKDWESRFNLIRRHKEVEDLVDILKVYFGSMPRNKRVEVMKRYPPPAEVLVKLTAFADLWCDRT